MKPITVTLKRKKDRGNERPSYLVVKVTNALSPIPGTVITTVDAQHLIDNKGVTVHVTA